jgi:hypothetical protein
LASTTFPAALKASISSSRVTSKLRLPTNTFFEMALSFCYPAVCGAGLSDSSSKAKALPTGRAARLTPPRVSCEAAAPVAISRRALAVAGLIVALGTAGLTRVAAPHQVRLTLAGFTDGLAGEAWSRSYRASLDPPAAPDGRTDFYFREAAPNFDLVLPFTAHGPLRLTLRAGTRVRSAMEVFLRGTPAGRMLVTPGPWRPYTVEIPEAGGPVALSLAQRPLPLVRGAHLDNPELLVDYLEVEAPGGLSPDLRLCLAAAAVPIAVLAFSWICGLSARMALAASAVAGLAAVSLTRLAPLPFFVAVPRLLPVALLAGAATWIALGRWAEAGRDRGRLAALVALGVVYHGSVVFFPEHAPPDIEIHVRRTRDFADVPLRYGDLIRYGSHLPTASQTFGQATEALGESVLLPYSPLPYLFYYALDRAGMDLHWAMTVLNAALAMAVAVGIWIVARRVWGPEAAWPAALLYSLDLAVWHHLGRSHAPAVFGGALSTAALLWLVHQAATIVSPVRAVAAGLVLAVAVLGYSSLVALFGLFGLALLVALALDARGLTRAARLGVACALAVGGVVAGALFYFHYLPAVLGGLGQVESGPDPFPGRTFFIFHNESRQSYRIWVLGFWMTLLGGLLAAPIAIRRGAAEARPFLVCWLAAWALIMVLKEPFLLPRLFRWAKEDQFVSPLLCLLMGGAIAALPRRGLRWAVAAAVVAGAAAIQLRDFALHARSLAL